MKIIILCVTAISLSCTSSAQIGQFPPFTKWYQNPLGFSPLSLHTANGIIIPGAVAAAVLLFSKKDTAVANRFSYFNESGISQGWFGDKTTIFQNNTGILFHARKWMALGAEFTAYHTKDDKNNTWGFGIRPFVRFYPVNKEKFRFYFESGAGIIGFLENFPQPSGFFGDNRTGTHWNGSPKYGIGAELNIDRSFSLQFGIRHAHISNGNIWGEENNPGHDSNGFSFGLINRPLKRK